MNYHHGNLRRELLDRAAHVIAEQGVEALSLRALALELGVSHAAPARHFKDKAGLLRVLAKEGFHKITAYILAAGDRAASSARICLLTSHPPNPPKAPNVPDNRRSKRT